MLKPSDFNNAVPKFTNGDYANNPLDPTNIEEPGMEDYNRGVEPLETLPAQWWNWLCNQFTSRFNKLNTYVLNLFNEITELLSLLNITPDGTESVITKGQLKNFFKELYPSYVKDHITITKSDVGLGNVPNVSTNNQTPTYTEASTLTALSSGEKLSVAFGKLAKAVSTLISHIANTNNPHSVTKAQVGLGSVVNTGDSATPVSGGTTKFTTGGAYTELAKKAVLTDLAPAFSTSTAYAIGDYVTYNGNLYRCTTAHTAGAWNASHFTAVNVGEELRAEVDGIYNVIGNTGVKNLLKSTISSGTYTFIALGANQIALLGIITLPAGKYIYSVKQDTTIASSTRNTLIIRNATNNQDIAFENAAVNYHNGAGLHMLSFTLATETSCSFQYWCHTPNIAMTISEFMVRYANDLDDTYQPYAQTNQELTTFKANKQSSELTSATGAIQYHSNMYSPNLNDLTVNGVYSVNIANVSTNNAPFLGAGTLIVSNFNNSNSLVSQIFNSINNGKSYIRTYNNETWSTWKQIITSGDDFFSGSTTSKSWLGKVFGHLLGREWKQTSTTTLGYSFNDVNYANGLFVASSDSHGLWWSTDGKAWTQTSTSTIQTYSFTNAIYGNGIWVASTNSHGLWWSTDGKTWTQTSTSAIKGYTVYAVTYGNGLFIASISNHGVWWSTDGKTWTQTSTTALQSLTLNNAIYANGIWVASTASKGLWWSTDGKAWTQTSTSSIQSDSFYSVSYGNNGIWVASSTYHGLWWSTDGKAWTQTSTSAIQSYEFINANYGNGIWVACSASHGLWWSTEGRTWIQTNNSAQGYRFTNVNYANGLFIAHSYGHGVWWSTDGRTWTQGSSIFVVESYVFHNAIYANGIWVASTNSHGLLYSDVSDLQLTD